VGTQQAELAAVVVVEQVVLRAQAGRVVEDAALQEH
jgi:hypothetical protein